MMRDVPQTRTDLVPDPLPEGVTVLDVREPGEWVAGHIDGSLHIPLMRLVERISELPTSQQLLVVCRVGSRSAQAAAYLNAQGYDAVNLAGGLVEWEAARRPLVSETGGPAYVE